MRYSKDFNDLLSVESEECLVGWGNPNSKILIIACEPSIQKDDGDQIDREIKKTRFCGKESKMNMLKWMNGYTHLIPIKILVKVW